MNPQEADAIYRTGLAQIDAQRAEQERARQALHWLLDDIQHALRTVRRGEGDTRAA